VLALSAAASAGATEPVTVENFVRAESDHMFHQNMKMMDSKIGTLNHLREPTSPDNQPVIRMNVDTLYSATILDLSSPITVTLADIGGRYQSMHVVNQDHYMLVEDSPGTYELTEDSVGTRFASVTFRTFADPNDPEDLEAAHAAQDSIELVGGGKGPLETPDWDQDNLATARKALSDLAVLGFDASYAFGSLEETRPIDHLVGAASGWGGLPRAAASYTLGSVKDNDGKTPYVLNVRDVPVDAFWSVTVYNAEGYLEANDRNIYSYNDVTAEANPDGSYTLHFGSCDDGRVNCIPITPGWNYATRMYAPREEILSGEWTFPDPKPIPSS
jgi:hypothetical protein